MKIHHKKVANKNKIKNRSLLFFGLASLLWFIFRTGTKPSRIVYPCQRAALANSSLLLSASIPISISMALTKTKKFASRKGKTLALLIILASIVISSELFWESLQTAGAINPNQEIQLTLEPRNATAFPASDIYVMNGRAQAHIGELIDLMGLHGLLFYKSGTTGVNKGPDGLIARDDVVLIKINMQWDYRGGTNTDVLKELIQAIVDHPDGFVGEIVVADNGQGWGSMDWPEGNAEDVTQSTQDVVNMFSPYYNVSTYNWSPIKDKRVDEYSDGNMTDGYIVYDTADPETGIYVSYPKFRTQFGTYISFKHGIWNGTGYEKRLKVINIPVLKSHYCYGVTAALKHYMGVQSEERRGGLANGHVSVATGGMGTLMVETGLPTLNIIDAIWINANPSRDSPSSLAGPETPYEAATRVNVLMASTDPVALDYWAAKHVLVQAASLIGYNDTHTLDPDNTDRSGVSEEAFGVWLNLTKNEIIAGGYNVTTDENQMNVYVYPQTVPGPDVLETIVNQINETRLTWFDSILANTIGPRPYNSTANMQAAAEFIAQELNATKSITATYQCFPWKGWEIANVIGVLPSANPNNQSKIVVGAHFDTKPNSPGADDDGSGVAVLLEVAKVLSSFKFNCTIEFVAFNAEEEWMVGSNYYVQQALQAGEDILLAINVDMCLWDNPDAPPNEKLWIVYNGTVPYEDCERFADIALNISYTYTTTPIQKISSTNDTYVPVYYWFWSDQSSFWQAGIPAIWFFEFMGFWNPYLHTPNDTMDAEGYNFTLATQAAQVVAATIAKLAGAHIVDITPPEILVLSPQNKTYATTSVPLTLAVNETASWIGYSLDGQTNVTITENITLSDLSDWSHYVVVYANDTAGNMGKSSTVYFTVDTTPPNITDVSQLPTKNNVLPEDEVKVNATVTDALSGVRQVVLNYTTSNGTWFTINMTNLEGNLYNATIPEFPYCTNVTYIIIAEDTANNTITTLEMEYEYQDHVIPEFPPLIIMPLFIFLALIAVTLVKKIRCKV